MGGLGGGVWGAEEVMNCPGSKGSGIRGLSGYGGPGVNGPGANGPGFEQPKIRTYPLVSKNLLGDANNYWTQDNQYKLRRTDLCQNGPEVFSFNAANNRRSSEIQGTALGKCLRAWTCIII